MRRQSSWPPRRRSGKQGGQALTEFALISPVFFGILFGIIGGALLMNAQASLDNATREAARQAALCANAMGAWTDSAGVVHAGGESGSACAQAAARALYGNLGILPVTAGNPTLVVDAPATGSSADCAPAGAATPYFGGDGCAVEVSVSYRYSFLVDVVLGGGTPSMKLTSTARSVGQ
jgi:Flp pilus assembly protein TadG